MPTGTHRADNAMINSYLIFGYFSGFFVGFFFVNGNFKGSRNLKTEQCAHTHVFQ